MYRYIRTHSYNNITINAYQETRKCYFYDVASAIFSIKRNDNYNEFKIGF